MVDTRNSNFIRFEKRLPDRLIRTNYGPISVWSMARLLVFNRMEAQERTADRNAEETRKLARVLTQAAMLFRGISSLVQFAAAVAKNGGAEVVIRVNSFSVSGENGGRLTFTNKNLQDIYDTLLREKTACIVVVSDLREYRLRQKITAAILYRPVISSLVSRAFYVFNRSAIDRLVSAFSESIALTREVLRNTILYQLASYFIWNGIYRYIRPKVVYYESPHNAFEAEIVAAKKNNIRTLEIYHGTLSSKEPSYFQKHLDFGGLLHSVCDEYLSQSKDQTRLMMEIGRYEKVTTIGYRSNLSLSFRQKMKLSRARNRPGSYKRKLLFITSITDNDVQDVRTYIRANRRYLLETFREIYLNLHPADSETRWGPLMNAYRFLHISSLPLGEDIVTSHARVVVSPTTVLQLRALKVDFVDLTRTVI